MLNEHTSGEMKMLQKSIVVQVQKTTALTGKGSQFGELQKPHPDLEAAPNTNLDSGLLLCMVRTSFNPPTTTPYLASFLFV